MTWLRYLLFISQSYWDWLSPEIKEYIVYLAETQHKIDAQNRELLDHLNSEFQLNLQLRNVWGLAMVRVTRDGRIMGRYFDIEISPHRSRFLGDSYTQAMSRINHVKSFM